MPDGYYKTNTVPIQFTRKWVSR